MNKNVTKLLTLIILLTLQISIIAKNMSKNEFLAHVFNNVQSPAQQDTLWLKHDLQSKVTTILEHPYPKLRLRYWYSKINHQTVWFLDEIGKERPISFAISVIDRKVDAIVVLAFRESRGGEIQMSSFTEQFNQVGLNSDAKLDRHIDGITGATMSVIAMKKITRLALFLHDEVMP